MRAVAWLATLAAVAIATVNAQWNHLNSQFGKPGKIAIMAFLDSSSPVDEEFELGLDIIEKELKRKGVTDFSLTIDSKGSSSGPYIPALNHGIFIYDKCGKMMLQIPILPGESYRSYTLSLVFATLNAMDFEQDESSCPDVSPQKESDTESTTFPLVESEDSNTKREDVDEEEDYRHQKNDTRNDLFVEEYPQHTIEPEDPSNSFHIPPDVIDDYEHPQEVTEPKSLEPFENEDRTEPKLISNDIFTILTTTEEPDEEVVPHRRLGWMKELIEIFCYDAGESNKHCKSSSIKVLNLAQTCCLETESEDIWAMKKCRKFGRKRCEKIRNFIDSCFENSGSSHVDGQRLEKKL